MMQRSTIFTIDPNTVHKGCPEPPHTQRVVHQGRWIKDHPSTVLPRIVRIHATAYEMERLCDPPLKFLDHYRVLGEMVWRLRTEMWSRPPEVEFDPKLLNQKVQLILDRNPTSSAPLGPFSNHIKWDDVPTGLTHGNPTFGHVMFTDNGSLVLIDPTPATPEIPDMPSVDLGKILVSALGLERVRYGEYHEFFVPPEHILDYAYDENERLAIVFWSVVHLLRYLTRTSQLQRGQIWEMVEKAKKLI